MSGPHMLRKALATIPRGTQEHLGPPTFAARRAHKSCASKLAHATAALCEETAIGSTGKLPALRCRRQMRADTVGRSIIRRPRLRDCRSPVAQTHRVVAVVNQLGCQFLVEVRLDSAICGPSRPTVQHPRIDDTHPENGQVHSTRPIVGPVPVLQPQIVLPTVIVAINLSAALVVHFRHLRLRHCQRQPSRLFAVRQPPPPLNRRPIQTGRGRRNEVSTLPVHPHCRHEVDLSRPVAMVQSRTATSSWNLLR